MSRVVAERSGGQRGASLRVGWENDMKEAAAKLFKQARDLMTLTGAFHRR